MNRPRVARWGILWALAALTAGPAGSPVRAQSAQTGDGKAAPKAAEAAPPGKGPAAGAPMVPPALVKLDVVRQEKLQDHWRAVGRLREVRRSVVAAEVFGRVMAVPADEGTPVAAGRTVLAKLDDVWAKLALQTAEAQLKQAEAAVVEAKAQLDVSRRDRERIEGLFTVNSAKPKEVDDARARERTDEARLQSAEAQVRSASVAVDRARTELSRLDIVAPFDGTVVKKMVEVGQWASQGTPVAEIISRGSIDAEIDVPENLINLLRIGAAVEVLVEPLRERATGQVRLIVPAGGNAARTFPVRVSLDDQGGKLKPGMSVLAEVPTTREAEVLTVPRDAALRGAAGWQVWISANGIALPVAVDLLFGHQDRYAVRVSASNVGPPLAPGTPVVVEGAERLFPTRPLIPAPGSVLPAGPPGVPPPPGAAAPVPARS